MQPPVFGDKRSSYQRTFAELAEPPKGDWADRLVSFLFSAKGRVSRKSFRRARLGFVLAYASLYLLIFQLQHDAQARLAHSVTAPSAAYVLSELAALLLAFGLIFWTGVVVTVKRWHDVDRSGLWALLGFIPFIGWIGQTIVCSLINGTRGPNRYGPAPR